MLKALLVISALSAIDYSEEIEFHEPLWTTKVVVQYLENGVPKTKVEEEYSSALSLEGCLHEVFTRAHLLWRMTYTLGMKQSKSMKLEGIGSICTPLR